MCARRPLKITLNVCQLLRLPRSRGSASAAKWRCDPVDRPLGGSGQPTGDLTPHLPLTGVTSPSTCARWRYDPIFIIHALAAWRDRIYIRLGHVEM